MGLVSGENAFFLLNRNTVDEYQLANSTRMVIGRTEQLKGVILSERDFKTSQVFGEVKQKVYFCLFLSSQNFMERVLEEKS